jgi:hypothetical protein
MKTISCFLLIALLIPIVFASYAQEKIDVEKYNIEIPNVPKKGKECHAKIILINGQKLKGVITSIGHSSIQMEKVVYKNRQGVHAAADKSLQYNEVVYSDIQNITIRGTIGESIVGFLLGTGVGILGGAIVGLGVGLGCEDCDLETRFVGLPLIFGAVGGAVLGPVAAVGPFIQKINIAGEYGNYQEFKNDMKKEKIKKKKKKRMK